MERNPQRELLVSCGMWCVAWRLSPRYCLSSSQQQGSWALTPRVPCGLEVCTPSTWKEIRSVSCWFRAECGVSLGDFRLATACHLRNNKAVGHLLLASRVVLRFARPAHGRNPQRELLVSCGMWCVAWRLSPRCCLSSSQQQAVGHLLLASRVVLRFARPAHGKKSAA